MRRRIQELFLWRARKNLGGGGPVPPTPNPLLTMDFAYEGEPFCWINADSSNLLLMDSSYEGEPFAAQVS